MRLVKDRGYLCTHCITDNDQVLCPNCNEYHPWGDYRVLNSLGRRSSHCRRCTGPGRERVFKPLTILTDKEEKEICEALRFEDGVWWMPWKPRYASPMASHSPTSSVTSRGRSTGENSHSKTMKIIKETNKEAGSAMSDVVLIDIFAGAGGLTEGFLRNDYEFVSHVEMDVNAIRTLETLTNDNGENIIEVASRVYGVPVDEIREALRNVMGDW